MQKAVVLIVMVFFFLSVCGQKKGFQHGAYVTRQGDTLEGYISLAANGQSLKFKKDQASTVTIDVAAEELKSLVVNNERYLIWYGRRSVTWLDPIEMEIKNVDSFRTELIMLKPIFEGRKYSLYEHKDETERYFISYAGVVEELQMTYRKLSVKEYRDRSLLFNWPKYTIYALYRDQIIAVLGGQVADYEKNLIEHTDYNQLHLIRLFKEMEKW